MPYSKFSSGKYCSVFGCQNSNRRLFQWKEELCIQEEHLGLNHRDCPCLTPFSFYSFPRDQTVRLEWIRKLNRKDFSPGKYAVVCSQHFKEGRPTEENPSPTLLLGYEPLRPTQSGRRRLRRFPFTPKQHHHTTENFIPDEHPVAAPIEDVSFNVEDLVPNKLCDSKVTSYTKVIMCEKSTQWNIFDIIPDHNYCRNVQEMPDLMKPSKNTCGMQTNMPCLSSDLLSDSDYRFYTSLPMEIFLMLVTALSQLIATPFVKLSVHDQLLLVFCRLRLGLLFGDLARRFNVSSTHACSVFKFWMPRMAEQMKTLLVWLPRDTIHRTLPDCFKVKYPNTTCVIDCAEIVLERARSHWMRAVTYSHYKSRNTIKFLIAIAPNGLIMFISDSFGGRASDQFITEHSGILKYFLPGDEIMADRGFFIEDILPPGVKLNVPPYTKGKKQLSEPEVTKGRRIATVRVHVERVIAQLKKYRIFKATFPLSQSVIADSILVVCAALCNLQKSVVPMEKKG